MTLNGQPQQHPGWPGWLNELGSWIT